MNKIILIALLTAGLAACASPKRVGPPAPIVTAGRSAPKLTHPGPKPPAPLPEQQGAKVYPYRPLTSAPDTTPTPRGTLPAQESRQAQAGSGSKPALKSTPKQGTQARSANVPSKTTPPAPRVVVAAPPPLPTQSLSPAVGTLVKQAEQQRRGRDYVGAAANLERALGLQPLEPYVWNRLARVRMEQGRYVQARNLASRSNVLTGGKRSALTRDNWNIISAASRAAGDMARAKEAQRNARGG